MGMAGISVAFSWALELAGMDATSRGLAAVLADRLGSSSRSLGPPQAVARNRERIRAATRFGALMTMISGQGPACDQSLWAISVRLRARAAASKRKTPSAAGQEPLAPG